MQIVLQVSRILARISRIVSKDGIQQAILTAKAFLPAADKLPDDVIVGIRDLSCSTQSFDRYLAASVALAARHGQFPQLIRDDAEAVLNGCLLTGRFQDVLVLSDQLQIKSHYPEFLPTVAIAAYRLGEWRMVFDALSNASLDDQKHFKHYFIRASIELGLYNLAKNLLCSLSTEELDSNPFFSRLKLMLALEMGPLPTEATLEEFLNTIPLFSQAEAAAFARYVPLLERIQPEQHGEGLDLPFLYSVFRERLQIPLFPALQIRSEDQPTSGGLSASLERKIGLLVNAKLYPNMGSLSILINAFSENQCQLVPISSGHFPCQFNEALSLAGMSPQAARSYLISQDLDVVIDAVGLDDSFLLQLVSQRVASIQLAWIPQHGVLRSSDFYDRWIVDRWTLNENLQEQPASYLKLSGSSVLSLQDHSQFKHHTPLSRPIKTFQKSIAVFGSPRQLQANTSILIGQLFAADPTLNIIFLDESWGSPDRLDDWLSLTGLSHLSASCEYSADQAYIRALIDRQSLVGLVSCDTPPIQAILAHLDCGMPIVYCTAEQVCPTQADTVMNCLGLGSFILNDFGLVAEALSLLFADIQLYKEISENIKRNMQASLLNDYDLFAREICASFAL